MLLTPLLRIVGQPDRRQLVDRHRVGFGRLIVATPSHVRRGIQPRLDLADRHHHVRRLTLLAHDATPVAASAARQSPSNIAGYLAANGFPALTPDRISSHSASAMPSQAAR